MILHICTSEKFIPDYIKFINTYFDVKNHIFIIYGGDNSKYPVDNSLNVTNYFNKIKFFKLVNALYRADKVIVHGLFEVRLIRILAVMPWILRKTCWVIWGGDLYRWGYQYSWRNLTWYKWALTSPLGWLDELARRFVIKRFGVLITHVEGDYALARERYQASGRWQECFMYPSNLYQDFPLQPKIHDTINIQVGNSADPSNNHLEVLEKLKAFRDQSIRIYVPLSYGDLEYAETIISYGRENFADKFFPLTEFMPFKNYLDFLALVDIAIFNHKRQQGMGNVTVLLGLGKKIYLQKNLTSWSTIKSLNVAIFEISQLNLELLDIETKNINIKNIKEYFSKEQLKKQLNILFN